MAFKGPYDAVGNVIKDASGKTIAYCGTDTNRSASGPVIADFLAQCANGVRDVQVVSGDGRPDTDGGERMNST